MEHDEYRNDIEVEFIDEPEEAVPDPAGETATDGAGAKEARLQEQCDQLREQYLRKLADFDNYRKRQERDMAEFKRFANADLLRDLLVVVDNLERALVAPAESVDALKAGVELVLRQVRDLLARYGVEEVDPAGEPFDPALHEAIQSVPSADVTENTVVQVLQKGYVLRERLLRAAMVMVAVPAGSGEAREERGTDPQAD